MSMMSKQYIGRLPNGELSLWGHFTIEELKMLIEEHNDEHGNDHDEV